LHLESQAPAILIFYRPLITATGGISAFLCRFGAICMPTSTIFGGEIMFEFEKMKVFRYPPSSYFWSDEAENKF